jgi:D-3-phosphoglycerate dehydrogenase / 2-oxoglutarate reductase
VIVDRDAPCTGACRILVADKIAAEGIARLEQAAAVDVATGLSVEQLQGKIGDYDALVVRSETQVTEPIIAAGRRLKVIGRAGVGVDNIDVTAATRSGVVVVNSAQGNTTAAAEHAVAMLLSLSRKIPAADASLRRGEWRRGDFVGVEVYNKVVGVIGLGNTGREVARRCRGLGMRVLALDPFVTPEQAERAGVELVELEDLLRRSDYISVHTHLTPQTRGMLGERQFAMMRPGVRIINCARGGIVDEAALQQALEAGHVAGAALDVFDQEPPPADHPLLRDPRVVVTPHLGASTQEAQVNVALDVADQVLAVLAGRPPRSAVNMPAVSPEEYARLEPYLRLGDKIGRLQAQLAEGPVRAVQAEYSGDLIEMEVQPITRAILLGLLRPIMPESINIVNAPVVAESRGIRVTESKLAGEAVAPPEGWSGAPAGALPPFAANRIVVTVESGRRRAVSGSVLAPSEIRIEAIDQFRVDLVPEGYLLFCQHVDRPGIIGSVGTLLGDNGINIAQMYVGREGPRKRALMVVSLDDPVPETVLAEMRRVIEAESMTLVEL